MYGQNQGRKGDKAKQISNATSLKGIDAQTSSILNYIASAVTCTEPKQDEDAARNRQKSVDAEQQKDKMIMKISRPSVPESTGRPARFARSAAITGSLLLGICWW